MWLFSWMHVEQKVPLFWSTCKQVVILCRRVVRPWLGLKMLDLNDMIIAQLKERDPSFPNVKSGILVPVVCFQFHLYL